MKTPSQRDYHRPGPLRTLSTRYRVRNIFAIHKQKINAVRSFYMIVVPFHNFHLINSFTPLVAFPVLMFFVLNFFNPGDSLLHLAGVQHRENAALFLAGHGAEPNVTNKLGETPLHSACRSGLMNLVSKLLHW